MFNPIPTTKVAVPKDGTQAKIGGQSYTIRRIEPAKNADVVSVARAMNREQFAPMLKNVFQPELDATRRAFETGVYVSWRIDGTDFDCQRVGYPEARCFCMHSLADHENYVEVRHCGIKPGQFKRSNHPLSLSLNMGLFAFYIVQIQP